MKTIFTFFAIMTLEAGWSQPLFKASSDLVSPTERSVLLKTLNKFSVVRFNTAAVKESIRRQQSSSLNLKIDVDGVEYDLRLIENEMRSTNFKKVLNERGERKNQLVGECHTYKGTIGGDSELKVRLLVSDELFLGHIITPSGYLYFEPIQRYLIGASPNDRRTLVFKAEDLKNTSNEICNPISIPLTKIGSKSEGSRMRIANAPTSCRILEFQAIGDEDWFYRYGVQSYDIIDGIINQVEALYETSFNMRISLIGTEMWTAGDPYNVSGGPEFGEAALNELRDVWNTSAYYSGLNRDLVHMFTGRNFSSQLGQLRGIHYTDVVCNRRDLSYGLTIDGPYNISNTTAHEIGHGFNALHPDQTGDPEVNQCGTANASVMCQGDKRVPPYFSAQQLGRINTHIQNNEACLLDYSSFEVGGPNQLCNSATYSAYGPRNFQGRTWTSSANIALNVDPNYTYTVTATALTNGPGWIEASFNAGCAVTQRKNINVSCGGRLAAISNLSDENMDNILVYPNPTSGRFKIRLNTPDRPKELLITSITGRQIHAQNLSNRSEYSEIEIDFGRQTVGTYLIHVTTSNQTYTKKIMIGQ
jgi:hypothetical protein